MHPENSDAVFLALETQRPAAIGEAHSVGTVIVDIFGGVGYFVDHTSDM